MEINARANKALTKVIIEKQTEDGPERIDIKEAQRIHRDGDVTECNIMFDILVEYFFKTEPLLEYYRKARDSSTDDS